MLRIQTQIRKPLDLPHNCSPAGWVYIVHAGYIYSNVPQLPSRTLLQCHHSSCRSSSSTCAFVTSSMAEIWLGLAGDLCSPEYPCDHYTTRVGGAPVFPGSAVPWGSSPPKCQVCGSPLSMVLQVGCRAVISMHFLKLSEATVIAMHALMMQLMACKPGARPAGCAVHAQWRCCHGWNSWQLLSSLVPNL